MSDLIIYGTNKFDRMVNLNKVPSYSGNGVPIRQKI